MDSVRWNGSSSRWVSPFGNPRIKACLRLPEAYRSLPRLHRLLAPRHPPYALSSLIIKLTQTVEAFRLRRLDSVRLPTSSACLCRPAGLSIPHFLEQMTEFALFHSTAQLEQNL